LALAFGLIGASGCSPHQAAPATPATPDQTPTNRSFANSTDNPNTPLYEKPGQQGGAPATITPVPTHARFDENAPLAIATLNAIQADKSIDAKYIACSSQGTVVEINGTTPSKELKERCLKIARSQPGVTSVVDKISVQSP
jgi:hypothetical protein